MNTIINNLQVAVKKLLELVEKNSWIIFIFLLLIGLYLRFWHIAQVQVFGWDQARDAFAVRDILRGHFTLVGPKIGVGYFSTGPLYYYFLAPFYFFTKLDPMASNYVNILENIINFILLYFVTKKLFTNKAALFTTLIYAVNLYLIGVGKIPWNVTLMPGVAALIFYSLYNVYLERPRWIFLAWTLSGLYFSIHFTAIFLPLIILLSLLFVKDKKKAFLYSLYSIPLYLIWFIPNIIYLINNAGGGAIQDFLKYYFIGFHFQFLLQRLPYVLVMFKILSGIGLYFKPFSLFEYILPLLFIIVIVFFEKDPKKKILAYLCSLWFFVPLVAFTIYGGPLSEYYFLYDVPIVLWIFIYLQQRLLQLKYKPVILTCLLVLWSYYVYQNTKDQWIKPDNGGLQHQKEITQDLSIKGGNVILYNIGDIRSYYYQIWLDQKIISKTANNHQYWK